MVIRIFRNIQKALLFVAAGVLFAHMIIPHDHHSSDYGVCEDSQCPLPRNNQDHNKRFPVHCHSFNDLASEKIISVIVVKCINFDEFIQGRIFDFSGNKITLSESISLKFFSLPFDLKIRELSLFRAPPPQV